MPLFPVEDESALYFSMFDLEQPWCRWSHKPFQLEGIEWPSAEHYYQAAKFDDGAYKTKIQQASTPAAASKLGKAWLKPKRKGWKQLRKTMMTRALYTQCQAFPEMAAEIIKTGERRLVESSQFDYFWGCGRDRRGDNSYGEILMGIRQKLLEKQQMPL